VLSQLNTFLGGLDAQKADIVRAIDAMDRLTTTLNAQRATIGGAVDSLAPGLTVIADQRAQLTSALTALGELGQVGTRVINQTRDDTLASLRALQPILTQLVAAGDHFPKSLDFMLSYPFPPNADQDIVGDTMNLHMTLDLNAADILSNLLIANSKTAAAPPTTAVIPRKPAAPSAPAAPPVLGKALPPVCIPLDKVLPGLGNLPAGCTLPPECKSLPPGSPIPPGAYVPPDGVLPLGTVLPQGTRLIPGTVLTPGCILPPTPGMPALPVAPGTPALSTVTGEVVGQIGGLTDVLKGGLHP
jgi:phospholipid/cholesterol/gamma-HCH transport system substrate-binding protein